MSTHFFYEKNPDFSRQFMMDEDTTEEDPMT